MPDDIEILKKIKEAEEKSNAEFLDESRKLKDNYDNLVRKSQQDIEAEISRLQSERREKLDEEIRRLREAEENSLRTARQRASEMKLKLDKKEASKILFEAVKKFLEE
jgi:vacuolar-type H+-ATPase subunit H